MNPLVYWIDQLWDLQVYHLGHWFALTWVIFQIGLSFGWGFSVGLGRLKVKMVDK